MTCDTVLWGHLSSLSITNAAGSESPMTDRILSEAELDLVNGAGYSGIDALIKVSLLKVNDVASGLLGVANKAASNYAKQQAVHTTAGYGQDRPW